MALSRPYHVELGWGRVADCKQWHQLSSLDMGSQKRFRKLYQASSGNTGIDHCVAIADLMKRCRFEPYVLSVFIAYQPVEWGSPPPGENTAVISQFGQRFRRAEIRDIGGRGTDNKMLIIQFTGDEIGGVFHRTKTDGYVKGD